MNDSIPDRRNRTAACNIGPVFCKAGLVLAFSLLVTTLFAQNWYPDLDGDGFGDGFTTPVVSPTQPPNHVLNPLDCNDALPNNSIWSWVGASPVSSASITMTKLALAPDGTPFALYQDFATTDKYVRKFSGAAWTAVGGSPITTTIDPIEIQQPDMAVNSLGEPYICFLDFDAGVASNNKATVLKFDGTLGQWVLVGSRRFSAELEPNINIRIMLHNDVPYVIFGEGAARTMTVMKFDVGTGNWVNLGGTLMGIVSDYVPALAARGNMLYAAVVDRNASFDANTLKTIVLSCDISAPVPAWTQVGTGAFPYYTSSGNETPRIAVSSTGIPYVAYYDDDLNQVIVQKYESGAWAPVGPSGNAYVHSGTASYVDLAVDNQNVPVVAFQDNVAGKIALKKLSASGSWSVASTPSINGIRLSLAISAYTNAPYLAFKDSGSEKAVVYSVAPQIDLPVISSITSPQAFLCTGESAIVSLTGNLNHAARWKWYSGTCGDALSEVTPIDPVARTSISVSPGVTTTYYVRGEGNCISASATCTVFTVGVTPKPTWYQDSDGDGLGNATASTLIDCGPQPGHVINNADCNDNSVNASSWDVVGGAGFATGPNAAGAPNVVAIAFDNSNAPFVAYRDASTTPTAGKVTVMKYDGIQWVLVGTAGFSSGAATFVNIAFYGSTPYVAYIDGGKVNVKKFDAGSWVTVGATNFSAGTATSLSMAMNINDGTPYVVYTDGTSSPASRATVMRFNGTLWEVVGVANFTTAAATSNAIAIDSRGTPYVSFADGTVTTRLSVMKFNGVAWTVVGATGISVSAATFTSIKVDSRGVPYVAYRDAGVSSGRVVVHKYVSGTSWTLVGPAGGVSAAAASFVSLALDKGGAPYVSYTEGSIGKTMKYNGASWTAVGTSVLPTGVTLVDDMSIGVNATGVPYVVLRSLTPAAVANRISVMKMGPAANLPVATDITSTRPHFCPGTITSATLTVVGSLNDATEWKWYKGACGGGTALTPASATTVDITAESTPGTDVTYYVRGEGACIASVTCANNLMIRTRVNPSITSAPPLADREVCEAVTGVTAFAITAIGDGVSYQWQKDGTNVGTNANSLSLPSPIAIGDAGIYKITVTGTCATPAPVTDDAELTVRALPRIVSAPMSDKEVCENATGVTDFTITAAGYDVHYQWEKSGSPAGTDDHTFDLPATMATGDAGTYKVTVTGHCATPAPVTDEATLTVRELPRITGGPMADKDVCENATGVSDFMITATGYNLHYQWQKNGTPDGIDASNFDLPATMATGDAGTYKVTVTGFCATPAPLTDEATLTVRELPRITSAPMSDKEVCENATGVTDFTITATGYDVHYQWEKNGSPVGTDDHSFDLPATMATGDAGTYKVTVTGHCATPAPVTDEATLTVRELPRITGGPMADKDVCENATGVSDFTITATGYNLHYQWQKNGTPDGIDASNFDLPATMATGDAGTYKVTVTGFCATPAPLTDEATLTVRELPRITSAPMGDKDVCENATGIAGFTIAATGYDLHYQWQKDGAPIGTDDDHFDLPPTIATADAGTYKVTVTGLCATPAAVSDEATLTIRALPRITSVLSDVTQCEGTDVTFTATFGDATTQGQWQKNGTDLAGAVGNTLTLTNLLPADQATYTVVATNACDNITGARRSAALTVEAKPVIVTSPADLNACDGAANVTFSVSATGAGVRYQWQTNNGASGTWRDITGENDRQLVVNNVNNSLHNRLYHVLVGGTCGPDVTSADARLLISAVGAVTLHRENPAAANDPAATVVCAGSEATFTGVVTGTATGYRYQWQQNNGSGWTDITGETGRSMTLSSIPQAVNNTSYRVVAGNPGCTPVPSAATLITVNALSNITAHPTDAVTCEGGSARFTVSVTGTALAYQWQMHSGAAWENLPGAVSPELNLLHVSSVMNAYQYRVIVDAAGCTPVTSDIADLTVSRLPDMIAPPAPAEVCMDQNAVFTVIAEGSDISYIWEENRGSEWTALSGENSASLLLRRVPPAMNGYLYRVRVISPGCTPITSGGAQLIINTQPGQTGCSQSLLISEGVSPNGDDQLDRWIIEGIELYPNNNVKLYNVWGDLVFERKGYDNELHAWRGETNKGLKIGQEAPDGTYFYFIDLGNDNDSVLRGFVVLKR
ncbi:gliding motility-associated C-terminal domain-containing protein [Fulvivirgaceae bacterium PWU4]|uniref:Gliding motility-associated C-terminal domain-containing protein n=1 Tax=Chryseosolibacter histidini TaxID=2782349 RepID=A0AAP2DMV5_9BACT|nr:gliding motility-associated C-terminal domain-containing protein [Chryseosolibacter histidini]MBT1699260.1 gliding motility-associated C-terminal domain-containing protein [Chryseosolibacter histidini]